MAKTTSKCPGCSSTQKGLLGTKSWNGYSLSSQLEKSVEKAALSGSHFADKAHKSDGHVVLRNNVQCFLHHLNFSILFYPDQLNRLTNILSLFPSHIIELAMVGF